MNGNYWGRGMREGIAFVVFCIFLAGCINVLYLIARLPLGGAFEFLVLLLVARNCWVGRNLFGDWSRTEPTPAQEQER